ncbi:MAG: hypothetical protein HYU64_21690 [Armatimonadetes bacterium]|nr:hypothetical protein [Armatimonadota bacterium]
MTQAIVNSQDQQSRIATLRQELQALKSRVNQGETESVPPQEKTGFFEGIGQNLDQTTDQVVEFAKDHPLLTQAGIAAGGVAVGYGLARNGSSVGKGLRSLAEVPLGLAGGGVGLVAGGIGGATLAPVTLAVASGAGLLPPLGAGIYILAVVGGGLAGAAIGHKIGAEKAKGLLG